MPSIPASVYSFVRDCFKDSTVEEQCAIGNVIDFLVIKVCYKLVEEGTVTKNDVRMLANEIFISYVFEPKIDGDNVGLTITIRE